MAFVIDPPAIPSLPILGSDQRFPLRRVFCVGRNFADHAAEMGAEVDRQAPFYFTKSCHHVRLATGRIPMAQGTRAYHHEIELVVAVGKAGQNIPVAEALSHVFGYAPGLDMTRRDLQTVAKDKRRPWDVAKDAEASALVAHLCPVYPTAEYPTADCAHPQAGAIQLRVNGTLRQDSDLSHMVWSVPEVIADLSQLYKLQAGDLIFMGTPAGVGPVQPGDTLQGTIDGLSPFDVTFCCGATNTT